MSQETETKHAPLEGEALGRLQPLAKLDAEGAGPFVPVPLRISHPMPKRRRWARIVLAWLAFCLAAGGGTYYWWQQSQAQLPPGIVWGNGRLEADEINIATKYAGRIVRSGNRGMVLAPSGQGRPAFCAMQVRRRFQ